MTTAPAIPLDPRSAAAPAASSVPDVPAWVARLVEAGAPAVGGCDGAALMRVIGSGGATLISVRVPGAVGLDAEGLSRATQTAYQAIAGHLHGLRARHAVRFWNFIPRIHDQLGASIDRYMAFNAGRYGALCATEACRHDVGSDRLGISSIPTATGVGHAGADLLIHGLALIAPGRPVENPRQVPAYRYSPRYGPLPPCFARATSVTLPGDTRESLLVGGTASVVGEDSCHAGDLGRQFEEMCSNLRTLVERWDPLARADWVAGFREVRVYAPQGLSAVAELVRARFPKCRAVEVVRADLCRRELLLEIEAVVHGHDPLLRAASAARPGAPQ
jgi:chorismate lyase / 3-hydroxybenzoate synthase